MLKKWHRISKAFTIAQLFGWSWEKATFKHSSRAHWKVVKGRMRPKTSNRNRHLYIKKKGGLPSGAPQEIKVITPASLNEQLIGVFRACQLHLALKSNDTRRRGERGLIFQNVIDHPIIANNGRWGRCRPNAMDMSHEGRRPDISTTTTSPHTPRSRRGKDHNNQGRLPGSSGRPRPPVRARSTPTSTTQIPHPLRRGGLIVGGTIVSIFWWGTTKRNDLPGHHGLLNWAPRITASHVSGRVIQEWRHCGRWNTLKNRRQWRKKEKDWM